MPAGQPTKYKEEFNRQVYLIAKLGSKDREISEFFNVCEATINNWKQEHPKFLESLKEGKDYFDTERVEGALLHRALGYEHPEEKIFCNNGEIVKAETIKHYPPDTGAAALWLKNRNPDRWRDKQEIDMTVEAPRLIMSRILTPDAKPEE